MKIIKEAKSKKIPNLRWQSDMRNNWATSAVKIMLTQTTILCADDLISNGKSSLGTNHPRGPQDLPYAKTNKKITTTRKALTPFPISLPCPKFTAKTAPVIICKAKNKSKSPISNSISSIKLKEYKHVVTMQHIISKPASRKNFLLPYLSTKNIEMTVATRRAPLVIKDENSEALAPKPKLWKMTKVDDLWLPWKHVWALWLDYWLT